MASKRQNELPEASALAADDTVLGWDTSGGDDVQVPLSLIGQWVQELLADDFQPLDSDLTAIAALTTTAYGRSLMTLADQAALQAAVGSVGGGEPGADGADGADGVGVPAGGTTGQSLVKASNTDYDTQWGNPSIELSDENPLPLAASSDFGTGLAASREDHVHGWSGLVVNDSNAVLAVQHGATAGTTRPSTPGVVLWIGSVTPTNALARDIVFTEA